MPKLYFINLFLLSFISYSQVHLLDKIPLSKQVADANTIFERKVISKKSYWDSNRHNIYTVHKLEISKVYKGSSANHINIVTSGGMVGMRAQQNYPLKFIIE